jgi:hypothetical protein
VEAGVEAMTRRLNEQETGLRRMVMEVEAVRGRPRQGSDSSSVASGSLKALESVAQHTTKRVVKVEKDVAAVVEKVSLRGDSRFVVKSRGEGAFGGLVSAGNATCDAPMSV